MYSKEQTTSVKENICYVFNHICVPYKIYEKNYAHFCTGSDTEARVKSIKKKKDFRAWQIWKLCTAVPQQNTTKDCFESYFSEFYH